jgi:hypothetical protein
MFPNMNYFYIGEYYYHSEYKTTDIKIYTEFCLDVIWFLLNKSIFYIYF